jgi:hypothetical protein
MTTEGFAASLESFEGIVGWLGGPAAAALTHGELEVELAERGRELLRRLFQDHLQRLAAAEERVGVVDASGVERSSVEPGHRRALTTVFGEVTVERKAYRQRHHPNLHPLDAVLNLPVGKHSHGLRRLAAIESSRGSFDDAVDAVDRSCGHLVAKRQVEQLAEAVAVDFEAFYASRAPKTADPSDVVVLSVDGKGIVMRPEALREPTAKAATSAKGTTRLSRGEKRNRKRMATVAAVYDITPSPRSAADIITPTGDTTTSDTATEVDAPAPDPPAAANKWLCASVVDDAATVISQLFAEADRRDPGHQRPWIALVDGNNHQIDRLFAEADQRGVNLAVVCDFIHVLEYLWTAAWAFHDEGDPKAETWVAGHATQILNGHATTVATAIRHQARNLAHWQRANANRTANYLMNKAHLLDYPTALTNGWPIATGVIEGACRHLVKDRMDITSARWGLNGAKAILKLRALHANGDFDQYWHYHLNQEHHRTHTSRYQNNTLPTAA